MGWSWYCFIGLRHSRPSPKRGGLPCPPRTPPAWRRPRPPCWAGSAASPAARFGAPCRGRVSRPCPRPSCRARPLALIARRGGRLGGSVFGGRRRPAFSRRDYFFMWFLRGLSSGAATAARAPAPPVAGAAAPRLPLLLSPFFPSSLRAGRRARLGSCGRVEPRPTPLGS